MLAAVLPSARDKVHAVTHVCRFFVAWRVYLCDNDALSPQEGVTLHAMGVAKAAVIKECLPLPPAEQRAALSNALRVTTLCKQPPSISQPECHLHERDGKESFVDDDQAT